MFILNFTLYILVVSGFSEAAHKKWSGHFTGDLIEHIKASSLSRVSNQEAYLYSNDTFKLNLNRALTIAEIEKLGKNFAVYIDQSDDGKWAVIRSSVMAIISLAGVGISEGWLKNMDVAYEYDALNSVYQNSKNITFYSNPAMKNSVDEFEITTVSKYKHTFLDNVLTFTVGNSPGKVAEYVKIIFPSKIKNLNYGLGCQFKGVPNHQVDEVIQIETTNGFHYIDIPSINRSNVAHAIEIYKVKNKTCASKYINKGVGRTPISP